MKKNIPTVGIDLGTTCSAIAAVSGGTPKILKIDGELLMPSVVSFPENGAPLVGRPAVNREPLDPERTIRSAKRLMGSDHRWVFGELTVRPHEVAARVLERLCEAATTALGARPQRAVITVPAWFTQPQRAATRAAGELAGLEVARIINEPTAAALAHAHGHDLQRRALVYDFGGGTFDCSLIEQSGDLVEVKASHGDTSLGGDDLDAALVDLVLRRIGASDPALRAAIEGSVPAQRKLRAEVETAKIELSSALKAELKIPFLLDLDGEARHLEMTLDREELETLAEPLIERTIVSIEHVLRDSNFDASAIDELLLVGGSSRIPRVWERARERFGLEGSAAIPPDQAVVLGAAIQAAIVDGREVSDVLVDVAPYSLSVTAVIELGASRIPTHMISEVITPRNTPLPSRHSKQFFTLTDRQSSATFMILQGSDPNPLRNTLLGNATLEGIPPAPEGSSRRPISVEFRHNLDGMVEVAVIDVLSGKRQSAQIAADGDEEAKFREELLDELRKEALIPGAPSDPDPWCEFDAVAGADDDDLDIILAAAANEAGPSLASAATSLDIEACRATFDSILGSSERLLREVPEDALALATTARDGKEALERSDVERAAAIWDDLSDRMFELGVYL